MIFYEVLSAGFHTPLTKTQIGELFHAGRLTRDHRCKPTTAREWRTIDELFPLLKYQPSGHFEDRSDENTLPPRKIPLLALLLLTLLTTGVVAWYSISSAPTPPAQTARVTARHWPKSSAPVAVLPAPAQTEALVSNPPISYSSETSVNRQLQAQLAEQRRQADQQRARVEAENRIVERERLNAARAAAAQKEAGVDSVIPLDQETVVNVGGLGIRVMIHDNDVTSFDVWISGARRREVPKQKGLTGSRTDETLIYASGTARLYYVWEQSGKVNHCRLRVREE